jgi:hypothetical protein
MTANDDLARWGEPPANEAELALADLLAAALDVPSETIPSALTRSYQSLPPQGQDLLEAHGWIEEMISSVLAQSGLLEGETQPAGQPSPRAGELRLRVLRQVTPLQFLPVASTHPAPMVLRDLRRVPEDPDRVILRTGDRVRIEVLCDQDGYLTVFNIGPAGTLNLLYPEGPSQSLPLRARTPLLIADVELTPPAGRERLFAVWSRQPLAQAQLAGLVRPGAVTRDMQRVQDTLETMRAEDWQAVMLELEHRG